MTATKPKAAEKAATKPTEFTATGASDIKIVNPREKVRTLTVTIKGQARPEFKYQGAWSGKDVHTVLRNMARSYYLFARQLRREHQAIYKQKEGRLDAR